jgi:hypothetical protein
MCKSKLDFWSLLAYFIDNESLTKYLLSFLSEFSYFKHLLVPAARVMHQICIKMRGRMTNETFLVVKKKYYHMVMGNS